MLTSLQNFSEKFCQTHAGKLRRKPFCLPFEGGWESSLSHWHLPRAVPAQVRFHKNPHPRSFEEHWSRDSG